MQQAGTAHKITFGPTPIHAHVVFNGVAVAESRNAVLLIEGNIPAVCYFPKADVALDCFIATDHHTVCPFKGEASYWDLSVGDRREGNIAWAYEDPIPEVEKIRGHIAFYADRVDALVIDHSDPRAAD